MQFISLYHVRRIGGYLLAGLLVTVLASGALACSTVILGHNDRPLVAYSYDFEPFGGGILVVNGSGLQRRSIMENNPAAWVAEHESVSFTQFGPGMPIAGMNRAGLVISLMWNDGVRYSRLTGLPVVNELEFIQRLLDMSSTVQEAMHHARQVSIQGLVPVHFLLADSHGDRAIVMPSEQGVEILEGEQITVPALTNTSYHQLLAELESFVGFGGDLQIETEGNLGPSSIQRFAIAASAYQAGSATTPEHAFAVLENLANQTTRWQFVFDPVAQSVAVRSPAMTHNLTIDFKSIDFACQQFPIFFDLSNFADAGARPSFSPIAASDVQALLEAMLSGFGSRGGLNPSMASELSAYLLQAAHCPT